MLWQNQCKWMRLSIIRMISTLASLSPASLFLRFQIMQSHQIGCEGDHIWTRQIHFQTRLPEICSLASSKSGTPKMVEWVWNPFTESTWAILHQRFNSHSALQLSDLKYALRCSQIWTKLCPNMLRSLKSIHRVNLKNWAWLSLLGWLI